MFKEIKYLIFISIICLFIFLITRYYFSDTHNIAEGAGAAPLAAFMKERHKYSGRDVGLILSGGNIDLSLFYKILEESYSLEPFCD